MTFSVLFVCTGNICRSPMAERLFRMRIAPQIPIAVTSAGTMALVGHPMDPPSALALRELGGDPAGHTGRRLTTDLVAAADLVLTAETAHRSAIVQSEPMAFRRTFTIREFGRLGIGLEPPPPGPVTEDGLRQRVAEVAEQRGWVEPPAAGADDIGDPFGAPIEDARRCAAALVEAVDAVVATLALRPARRCAC